MDRQEAIKVIKDNWPEGQVLLKSALEFLIPELKESEDERIRKALIRNFINQHSSNFPTVDGFTREQILAWLEKQGERKPIIIIPQFKVGDIIKPKPYNEEHLIKDINENGYVLDVDIIIPFKDEDVWEIVEQKPAWNEEDEKMENLIIKTLTSMGTLNLERYHHMNLDEVKKWLESIKDRVQPKQEWNEEDEKILKELVEEVKDQLDSVPSPDCMDKEDENVLKQLNKWMDWLKSIKDRVQPQQKQEWSEEDIEIIKMIEDCLSFYKVTHCATLPSVETCIAWLKSLKPNQWKPSEVKKETKNKCPYYSEGYGCETSPLKWCDTCPDYKLYNHWKPSEKQLETLYNIIPHIVNSEEDIDTITELSILYDDLKTLI